MCGLHAKIATFSNMFSSQGNFKGQSGVSKRRLESNGIFGGKRIKVLYDEESTAELH